jgi:hypothetical protein
LYVRVVRIACALFACAAFPAGARADDFTWTGGNGTSSWADPNNWDAGGGFVGAPGISSGTLTFPTLGACSSCYNSNNDISSGGPIAVNRIAIDMASPYQITGAPISLGAGGIVATDSASAPPLLLSPASIALGLELGPAQTWTLDGGAGAGRLLVGVVGSDDNGLRVQLQHGAILGLTASDYQLGPLTIAGSDASLVGAHATDNGALYFHGALNRSGSPVAVTQAALVGYGWIGPLTVTAGQVIAQPTAGVIVVPGTPTITNLAVQGDGTLDANSELAIPFENSGTRPGLDAGELTATGAVHLGGATLDLQHGRGTCVTRTIGDVYTIASAGTAITGTFAGIRNGGVVVGDWGSCPAPVFLISYTRTTVTATVVGDGVKPYDVTAPTIAGRFTVGEAVTASTGSWSGAAPLTYSYRWQRCAKTCIDVAGATSSKYTLTSRDVDAMMRVVVSGVNSAGTAVGISAESTRVHVPAAQIRELLDAVVAPRGEAGHVSALLAAGGYTRRVTLPEAGVLTVKWHDRSVLVATGSIAVVAAGRGRIAIELTHAGRRLLLRSAPRTLTGKATFAPVRAAAIARARAFALVS